MNEILYKTLLERGFLLNPKLFSTIIRNKARYSCITTDKILETKMY